MSNENTLFNPDNVVTDPVDQTGSVDDTKNYLEELVGEGKKYKDEAALAKAVAHANAHIQRLEQEQAGLREDLGKRLTLEEAVAKMTEAAAPKAPSENAGVTTPLVPDQSANVSEIKQGMTPEEILEIVNQKINETENQRTRSQNLSLVKSELEKTLGSSFPAALISRAQELGVTKEFLDDLAATHPKVFLEMVNPQKSGSSGNAPPVNQVNSAAAPGVSNKRDQAYYTNMRRTDPNRYWSGANQSQMHKDAREMGDSWFN
mgnify:CR=1 FL=1